RTERRAGIHPFERRRGSRHRPGGGRAELHGVGDPRSGRVRVSRLAVQRRRLLRATLLGAAWWCGAGHTPYRQWRVYRQKHLLIGSSRADPASYDLARQVAGVLVRELPDSRARSSRAPDQRRIASLLASDQWQVAVLLRDDALDLARGRGMFEPVGPVPLSVLFAMDEHL